MRSTISPCKFSRLQRSSATRDSLNVCKTTARTTNLSNGFAPIQKVCFKCFQSFRCLFRCCVKNDSEKIKKDVNALKILCELASESENEGALEVVRVQSLSLVGTAYLICLLSTASKWASLITNFIKLIVQVYENFKKNPNMHEKIVIVFFSISFSISIRKCFLSEHLEKF